MNIRLIKSGFTLTELLVVIGIIGFLSAIAVPAYGVIRTGVALQNTSQELENALRSAQNRSIASQESSMFGVEVTPSYYVLFRIDAGNTRYDIQTIELTPGLSASAATIQFARLTGTTTATSVVLSVGSTSKTLTIDANGRVATQ